MKKISIIIATYNAGQVLQRCLDSIRLQKMEEIELLIIDGNSKDNTLDIIRCNSDIIDYSISEPDKGIYDAWNKGIKIAKGEWIEFLGADDRLLEGTLNFYIDYLATEPDLEKTDIIFGRCWLVDKFGRRIRKWGDPYNWSQFRKFMRVSHGSALHNRQLFEEVGYFSLNFKICADYELLLRKKLNAKFVDREMLEMQLGGMSCSVRGLVDAFHIRKLHNTINPIINVLTFIKGIISLKLNAFKNKY